MRLPSSWNTPTDKTIHFLTDYYGDIFKLKKLEFLNTDEAAYLKFHNKDKIQIKSERVATQCDFSAIMLPVALTSLVPRARPWSFCRLEGGVGPGNRQLNITTMWWFLTSLVGWVWFIPSYPYQFHAPTGRYCRRSNYANSASKFSN